MIIAHTCTCAQCYYVSHVNILSLIKVPCSVVMVTRVVMMSDSKLESLAPANLTNTRSLGCHGNDVRLFRQLQLSYLVLTPVERLPHRPHPLHACLMVTPSLEKIYYMYMYVCGYMRFCRLCNVHAAIA